MSKIRTASDLTDAIDAEFAWRKKELQSIASLVHKNSGNQYESLCVRSAIAMLYAHWEGFIKKTGSAYLYFVNNQRLKHEDLAECFLAISIRQMVSKASHSALWQDHIEIVDFFRNGGSKNLKLMHIQSSIDTESNLSSSVLKNILIGLGLDWRPYELKFAIIDNRLLRERNSVSHGERTMMLAEDYHQLHYDILSLLQLFSNQILNASIQQLYCIRLAPNA